MGFHIILKIFLIFPIISLFTAGTFLGTLDEYPTPYNNVSNTVQLFIVVFIVHLGVFNDVMVLVSAFSLVILFHSFSVL